MPPTTSVFIGSHSVNIYQNNTSQTNVLIIILHGRGGKSTDGEQFAVQILQSNHNFTVATFDAANHGERIIQIDKNNSWDEENWTHALNMYEQMISASHSIDLMTQVLYLHLGMKNNFMKFATVGISQGAHSNLLSGVLLRNKIDVIVSLIGSCDYSTLMKHRYQTFIQKYQKSNKPMLSFDSLCPSSFLNHIVHGNDPINNIDAFRNIPLLLCAGEDDTLVPPSICLVPFYNQLKQQSSTNNNNNTKLFIQPKTKHQVTNEMKQLTIEFLNQHLLLSLNKL
jgi:hypothetical protein